MAPETAAHAPSPRPEPTDGAGPGRRVVLRPRRLLSGPLPAHWPLSFLVLGYPLWWVLGFGTFLPILLAMPLALQLARRRDLALPRGFGWWLLFLAWVCLGVFTLFSDAPGAVPGGDPSRLLVFGYRAAWYAAVTVWMLWLMDTRRDRLPDHTVHRLVGGLLAVALGGGVLALLAPDLEFRSALEWLLPGPLASNSFVNGLVHGEVADVQAIIGESLQPRPKAPFNFTNTWGSVVSLSLVFAVAALARSGGRARAAWIALLLFAPVPVLLSLNRGLWAALVLGAVGGVVLLAARGRLRLVTGVIGVLCLVALALGQTPLGEIPAERFGAQHSNERRSLLTEATVDSVTRGSPLVGFGNTRDVEGNFASISGGSTPDCPACAAPPLGTQGQAWLLLFAQGWVGLLLFGVFILGALWRSIRCRTLNETLGTFTLGIFVMQLFVYDTLGLPLLIAFLAVGLVAREQRETAGLAPEPSARRLLDRLRPALVPGLVLVLVGGVSGLGFALLREEATWSASTRVLLMQVPDTVPGTASEPGPDDGPGTMTIDTEARLMRSLPGSLLGESSTGPESPLRVTAARNTRVLQLTVTGTDPDEVEAASRDVAMAWMQTRRRQLATERVGVLDRFESVSRQLRTADGTGPTGAAMPDSTEPADRYVGAARASLVAAPLTPGEILTSSAARREGRELGVPLGSGLGLGLLAAALLTLRRPAPHPIPRRLT